MHGLRVEIKLKDYAFDGKDYYFHMKPEMSRFFNKADHCKINFPSNGRDSDRMHKQMF